MHIRKGSLALRTLALAASLGLLAACSNGQDSQEGDGSGEEQVTWKFAIEEIQGSVQDAYAQEFKRLVEERSQGRIKVTVYPYGALGTSADLTELVQTGSIQFAMASPGHLGSVVPEVQLFVLHYLFPEDEDQLHALLSDDQALYDTLGPAYRDRQLELLSLFTEGWMVWTANSKITQPDDFQGVKIRTMVSPLLLDAYEAYGANPTPMAYSEVYSGLQLKMIDAQVNPVFAIEEMSFYEVTGAMTLARHAPFVASVIASRAFLERLDENDREILRAAAAEAGAETFTVQREMNERRLEKIRERRPGYRIVELTDEQRARFREASLPVRERFVEMAGESGRRILETIERAVAEAS